MKNETNFDAKNLPALDGSKLHDALHHSRAKVEHQRMIQQTELGRLQAEAEADRAALDTFADLTAQLEKARVKFAEFETRLARQVSDQAEADSIAFVANRVLEFGVDDSTPEVLLPCIARQWARDHQKELLAAARDKSVGAAERVLQKLLDSDGERLHRLGMV